MKIYDSGLQKTIYWGGRDGISWMYWGGRDGISWNILGRKRWNIFPLLKNRLPSMMTSLIGRNYLCAPMSVYFNAYRDNAYNRGGEEILKVKYLQRSNPVEEECWINHLSQRLSKAKNKPIIPVQ